jgi:hypothetical protein
VCKDRVLEGCELGECVCEDRVRSVCVKIM